MYENVPGEMVGLLECATTLSTAVFSLNPVVVQLHHGNIPHGKQTWIGLQHHSVGKFVRYWVFQFVRSELFIGSLERFRFNGVGVNMISIGRNQEVLFRCEVLSHLLVEVHVDPENSGGLTDVLGQELVVVLGPQAARV